MGLIFAIFVGLIVGAIGGLLMRENYDFLLIDSLVGVGGAIIGDALYFMLSSNDEFILFSWGALMTEALVAGIAVIGICSLQRNTSNKESFESTDNERE